MGRRRKNEWLNEAQGVLEPEIVQENSTETLTGDSTQEQPSEQLTGQQPTESQTEETGIVPADVMEKVTAIMDAKDAELIEASLKGVVAPHKLVYKFKVRVREGGQVKIQEVKGLTALGVREVVRFLNETRNANITILPDIKIETIKVADMDYVVAIVCAQDRNGNRWWGAAQQPTLMKVKRQVKQKVEENGEEVERVVEVEVMEPDPFAVAKAVSKAQRNALRGLFPEPLVAELIDRFTQEGKVEELTINETSEKETVSEPKTEQPVQLAEVELTPEEEQRQVWRQIYRIAAKKFGDKFKEKLRTVVKENYDVDRLDLPLPLAKDLLARLESGEFDETAENDDFVF